MEKKNCPRKKLSHVLGDFNVNCFNYHDDANENHLTITFLKKPPFLSSVVLHRSQKFLISQVLMIIFNNSLKKDIIKSDVSDHFPMFFSTQLTKKKYVENIFKNKKRVFNEL